MFKLFQHSLKIIFLIASFSILLTFSCRGTDIHVAKQTRNITDPRTAPTATLNNSMKMYLMSDGSEISQIELAASREVIGEITYVIRATDTCTTIAKEFEITVEDIFKYNPKLKKDCTKLTKGELLNLPLSEQIQVTTTPTDPEDQAHIVQAGDTCAGIARTYQVTLNTLLAKNDLTEKDCEKLQIGTSLTIP